jgi:hypothetical protein
MFINRGWVLYLSERSEENQIGLHIEDDLSDEDVERYHSIIKGAIAQFGSVRLMIAIDNPDNTDLEEVWRKLKFSLAYRDDIERLAVVGDEEVEDWAVQTLGKVSRPEVRFFSPSEYDSAWDWLKE